MGGEILYLPILAAGAVFALALVAPLIAGAVFWLNERKDQ